MSIFIIENMAFKAKLIHICLLVAVLLLPDEVWAQFAFTTNNGSITITGYTGDSGVVDIPGTIDGFPVTAIGSYAFTNCGSFTSVTMPSGVTNIGAYAFAYCTNLTTITIPATVTFIGARALAYCPRLTGVYYWGNTPAYGSIILSNSTNATNYVQPGTTGWGTAFGGRLTALWIPSDFYACVTNNGTLTITTCMSTNTVVSLPGVINGWTVTGIGSEAFTNCGGLKSLIVPATITNIVERALYYCPNLTAITVDLENPAYSSSSDGVLFNRGQTVLVTCPMGKLGNFAIPIGVTNIGASCFIECVGLTNITIPDTVSSIGDWAFDSCGNLTQVIIPHTVTNFGNWVFYNCWSLNSISLSTNVTDLGEGVFFGCPNLASVAIPNNVTRIDDWAFYDCSCLTNVTFGGCLKSIGDWSFAGCTNLNYFTIPNGVTNLGSSAFYACSGLMSIVIPDSVTSIPDQAFVYCIGLTNATIGNNVASIGEAAFYQCYGLSSITIPDSVTSIGKGAFYGCNYLVNVTIGKSVTRILIYAFDACPSLRAVFFKGNAPYADYPIFFLDNAVVLYYLPGTFGWGDVFNARPSVLWNPEPQASGSNSRIKTNSFGFSISGTANIPIVVEACTNFYGAWVPLQSVSLTNGLFYFSDPQWTNHAERFYRLRSP